MNEKQSNDNSNTITEIPSKAPYEICKDLVEQDPSIISRLLEEVAYQPFEKLVERFKDPTHADIIAEPWLANDGHIYEEKVLDWLIEHNQPSIYTRKPLVKLCKVQTFIDMRDELFQLSPATKKQLHNIDPLFVHLKNCIINPNRNNEIQKIINSNNNNFPTINDEALQELLSLCAGVSNFQAFLLLLRMFESKYENNKEHITNLIFKSWKGTKYGPFPTLIHLLVAENSQDIFYIFELIGKDKTNELINKSITIESSQTHYFFTNLIQYTLFFNNEDLLLKFLDKDFESAKNLLDVKFKIKQSDKEPEEFKNVLEYIITWNMSSVTRKFCKLLLAYPKLLELCRNKMTVLFNNVFMLYEDIRVINEIGKYLTTEQKQAEILKNGPILIPKIIDEAQDERKQSLLNQIAEYAGNQLDNLILQKWENSLTGFHCLIENNEIDQLKYFLSVVNKESVLKALKIGVDTDENLLMYVSFDANLHELLTKYLSTSEYINAWVSNNYVFLSLFRRNENDSILPNVIAILGKEQSSILAKHSMGFGIESLNAFQCAVRSSNFKNIEIAFNLFSADDLQLIRSGQKNEIFYEIFQHCTPEVMKGILDLVGQIYCKNIILPLELLSSCLDSEQTSITELIKEYFPLKQWIIKQLKAMMDNCDSKKSELFFKTYFDVIDTFNEQEINTFFKNTYNNYETLKLLVPLSKYFKQFKKYLSSKLEETWDGMPIIYSIRVNLPSLLFEFVEIFKENVYTLASAEVNNGGIFDFDFLTTEINLNEILKHLNNHQRVELLKPVFIKRSQNLNMNKENVKALFDLLATFTHLIEDLFPELLPFFVASLGNKHFDFSYFKKEALSKLLTSPFNAPSNPHSMVVVNSITYSNLIVYLISHFELSDCKEILKNFDKKDIKNVLLQQWQWQRNVRGLHFCISNLKKESFRYFLKFFNEKELVEILNHEEYGSNFLQKSIMQASYFNLVAIIELIEPTLVLEIALKCNKYNENTLYLLIRTQNFSKFAYFCKNIFNDQFDKILTNMTVGKNGHIMQILLEKGTYDIFKYIVERTDPEIIKSFLELITIDDAVKQNEDYPKMNGLMKELKLDNSEITPSNKELPDTLQSNIVQTGSEVPNHIKLSFLNNRSQPIVSVKRSLEEKQEDQENEKPSKYQKTEK